MTNKIDVLPNDYTQNYPFCNLQLVVETFRHPDTQLKVQTNINSKVPKVAKLSKKNMLL